MENWEEIFRKKLERYESTLPEGEMDRFFAGFEAAGTPKKGKRISPWWIWTPAFALAAAALALLLFLPGRQASMLMPDEPEAPQLLALLDTAVNNVPVAAKLADTVNLEDVPARVAAAVPDTVGAAGIDADVPGTSRLADAVAPRKTANDGADDLKEETKSEIEVPVNDLEVQTGHLGKSVPDKNFSDLKKPSKVSLGTGAKWAVGTVGAVSGTALLRLASSFLIPMNYANYIDNSNKSDWTPQPELRSATHHIPVRAGVSLQFPISEQLRITTGLDYSIYVSSFIYSELGSIRQTAHYLGIPVRLDWAFVKTPKMDVYLGGGLEGDTGLCAILNGERVGADGLSLSLTAATGIQYRFTDHFGLYLEPRLDWDVLSQPRRLETYRTAHPLVFSASVGLRFNL